MVYRIRALFIIVAVIITLTSLYWSFRLLSPTPPKLLTMATGPAGSAYEKLGELYKETLAEHGVKVELISSRGAIENLEILKNGQADVGFATLGSPESEAAEELRSLGAMFFEPLWVFSNNSELDAGNVEKIRDLRISIGPPKSRSNSAARTLLSLNGVDPKTVEISEYEPAHAAALLKASDIDAQFVVSNAISPVISELLRADGISLIDFERADAYVALYPELTKLVVPAGVGSFALNLPPRDTRVLAFTAILAVQEGLHPITQSLFLEAAERIHGDPELFYRAGEFPQARDQLILLSDSAKAYYADGRPLLLRLLPYPVAVLVMQLLTAAIPLIGLVYPMLKAMPSAFHWLMRLQFHRVYTELRAIDRGINDASDDILESNQQRLESLQHRVTTLRVPVTYATKVYALKSHIGGVLQRVIDTRQKRADTP
ncbi:TAXI family TRAP transporter solute-binding subunit [Halioglobus sp. HI00S01]|uniref:TAXI family TRAP transporter solute-binding subunit n=1 Tax=Halioglobus sp. HI00S01 TaxID=1822214 RepID=UPI0012E9911A|nr:TAXI family TRAP transporter solute-binding subunit [Halioglobus sp. HI00S01]